MASKRKQEIERRKIVNLIRPSNRKRDCLKFYSGESIKHKLLKFSLFYELQELGFELYTECILLNGKRADMIAIREGKGYGFEFLVSETIEECKEKIKSYPNVLEWHIIKDFNEIDEIIKDL